MNFDPRCRPTPKLEESAKGSLLRGELVGGQGRHNTLRCVYPPERVTKAIKNIFKNGEDGIVFADMPLPARR